MKSYIYNKVVMRLVMGLLPFYLFTFKRWCQEAQAARDTAYQRYALYHSAT